MARVYAKKPDAKREKVTIPISETLLEKLRAYAVKLERTPTEAARMLIERGVEAEVPK